MKPLLKVKNVKLDVREQEQESFYLSDEIKLDKELDDMIQVASSGQS